MESRTEMIEKSIAQKVLNAPEKFENNSMLECHYTFLEVNFENFFDKNFNESFCSKVLSSSFGYRCCRHGVDGIEPDLIFDEKEYFEICLICDSKKKSNLIQRIKSKTFKSDDAERELLNMLLERVSDKATKKYNPPHPNLCLICPLPMIDWANEKMDELELLFVSRKRTIFDSIHKHYVGTGIFKDIFIIVPNIDGTWLLADLQKLRIPFIGDYNDPNYPYCISFNHEISKLE